MMFRFLLCLLLSYLAVAAWFAGVPFGPVSVHPPALALLLAARWFSPPVTLLWSFALGLAMDALGTGPLGLQAATLVFLAALLIHTGFSTDDLSLGRILIAVFGVVWCAAAASPLAEWVTRHNGIQFQAALWNDTVTSAAVTSVVGLGVMLLKQLSPRPRHAVY